MAISFDAQSKASTSSNSTSLTWSHTCAGGTDNYLVAGGITRTGSTPSSVTYNGSGMTEVQEIGIGAFSGISQWEMINPASGAHNIVVTVGSSSAISYNAISLSGCSTSPRGNINTASGSGGNNPSITVNSGNWAISQAVATSTSPDGLTPGSNLTRRGEQWTTGGSAGYSTGGTNSVDSTVSWGSGFGTTYGAAIEVLAPASGPTSVKTWDGLAQSSISTYFGNAVASTKSVNGVT